MPPSPGPKLLTRWLSRAGGPRKPLRQAAPSAVWKGWRGEGLRLYARVIAHTARACQSPKGSKGKAPLSTMAAAAPAAGRLSIWLLINICFKHWHETVTTHLRSSRRGRAPLSLTHTNKTRAPQYNARAHTASRVSTTPLTRSPPIPPSRKIRRGGKRGGEKERRRRAS